MKYKVSVIKKIAMTQDIALAGYFSDSAVPAQTLTYTAKSSMTATIRNRRRSTKMTSLTKVTDR